MKLIKCETCGASSFTDNKCDYCRNEYKIEPTWDEILEAQENGNTWCDDGTEYYAEKEVTEIDFQDTPEGKKLLKIMVWTLISIIWFAVCVFIPSLFLITICGLIILPVIKKLKK